MRNFNEWIDTFIAEKEIDLEENFEVISENGTPNLIPLGVVIEHIKITSSEEQKKIKNILVQIDFKNGNVRDFLKHLGKAIAQNL